MIEAIWKTFKRVVFLLGVLFLSANALAWIVLNSPPIQRFGLKWVNETVLQPYRMQLTWNSLSVNFLTSTVGLNGVVFSFLDPLDDTYTNDIGQLKIGRFLLGIDVLGSYLQRQLLLRKADVRGMEVSLKLDPNGQLSLLRLFPETNAGSKSEKTLPETIVQIRKFLPPEMVLADSKVKIGRLSDPFAVEAFLKNISILNFKKDLSVPIAIKMALGKGVAAWRNGQFGTEWSSFDRESKISNQLDFQNLSLELVSTAGNLKLKGGVQIPWDNVPLKYRAEIDSEGIDLGLVISQFGLPSAGRVDVKGQVESQVESQVERRLESQETSNLIPGFNGSVKWKNAAVSGFDVYSGQGKVRLKNAKLEFENLTVRTPMGGEILGAGFFDLEKEFAFGATATLRSQSFLELLKGFGARSEAFEFNINGSDILVEGKILAKGPSAFWLSAKGPLIATSLQVPSLQKGNKFRLPETCFVTVDFFTDSNALKLDNSSAQCSVDRSDKIYVKKGSVSYKDARVNFDLKGEKFDFAPASYFLGWETQGAGTVEGSVTADKERPVSFEGKIELGKTLLYGTHYESLKGILRIDGTKTEGSEFVGTFGASKNTSVQLNRFQVNYGNEILSEFEGRIVGDLSEIREASKGILGEDFPSLGGQTQESYFKISGPLLKPYSWDTSVRVAVAKLQVGSFLADNLEGFLNCIKGSCVASKVRALGSSVGSSDDTLKQASPQSKGSLFLDLQNLSREELALSFHAKALPIAIASEAGVPVTGVFDGRAEVSGKWKGWQGSVRASLERIRFGEKDLGSATLSGVANRGGDLDLSLNARFDQLRIRLKIPQNFSDQSVVYANLNSFDPTFLASNVFLKKWNLFGRVTGDFQLNGPGPLAKNTISKSNK
jgi:hypothetical protein